MTELSLRRSKHIKSMMPMQGAALDLAASKELSAAASQAKDTIAAETKIEPKVQAFGFRSKRNDHGRYNAP